MFPPTAHAFELRRALAAELPEIMAVDDEAGVLFTAVGLMFPPAAEQLSERPEHARWARAIEAGRIQVAVADDGTLAGFAALALVDGDPYLDQLSVRPACMRRSIGARLVRHAIAWACDLGRPLWLTTYAHVPWNRPYYERFGFRTRALGSVGSELRAIVESQREVLPAPEQRVAMVHDLTAT